MLLTLNEENVEACIRSVENIADEIVVVDTGSTDATLDLARSLGAKVFEHPPVLAVEHARDFALEKCTGEWVLVLDADERLTPALRQ